MDREAATDQGGAAVQRKKGESTVLTKEEFVESNGEFRRFIGGDIGEYNGAFNRMGIHNPTLSELRKHLDRYGPGGILESATHLPDEQFSRLVEQVERVRAEARGRPWWEK